MKKKYIAFIIIGVIIIGFIIMLIMFINSGQFKEYSGPIDDEYYSSNGLIDEDMASRISEKNYVMASGEILVEVTNKNSYGGDGFVYIFYYDKDNNMIKKDTRYITVNPNSKGYTLFTPFKGKEYDRYEVKFNIKYAYGMAFYNKCIKSKVLNKKDFYLYIEYTNKCADSIKSLEVGVLFYNKKNEIIGYSSTVADKTLRKNKRVKDYVIIPDDGDYGDISYTKAKTVINEAYNW